MFKLLKNIIKKLDYNFLNQTIFRFYVKNIIENKIVNYKKNKLNHSFLSHYRKVPTLLNILCDKHGTDKGEVNSENNPYQRNSHNYADIYDLMFALRRKDVKTLVECGLGTNNPALASSMGINGKPGASLRVWEEYFPNANIIGCDIDKNILFSDGRIKTYLCDQTNKNSVKLFSKNARLKKEAVDIIIDDGLHEFKAGKTFFENLIDFLSEDGIYIIEDVTANDTKKYRDYFIDHSCTYSVQFISLYSPKQLGGGDNRIIVIRKIK